MTTPGKRLLSPASNDFVNPDEKRQKGDNSVFFDESDKISLNPLNLDMEEERKPMMAELNNYMDTILEQVNDNGKSIKDIATRKEYLEVKDQMTAQGLDIQELRGEVTKLQDSIKTIEANVDLHRAKNLNRMSMTAG